MDASEFGRYRLLSLIGEGGMGKVYKAHDTVIDRVVAIKVLTAELGTEPGYCERFRREAQAAARLTEPHIIPIHDTGEINGQLYLVMPVIDGVDVQVLLRRDGPMHPDRAVHVVEQLAAALEAAHAAGLVHRDVKPSNALLAERDFVYLIDFGIAHDSAATKLTRTDTIVGSWAYMAPERFTDCAADRRADVYALACVLHECLTGATPYPGVSLEQQFAGHMSAQTPKPSTLNSAVPVGFDDVIARGMAKDPDQRYQSAGELAAAARSALTAAPSAITRMASADSGELDRTQEARVPSPSTRRWLIPAVAVVVVAVVVAGVLLFRNVLSPNATGGELVLTAATDPGMDPFMPAAASAPPTNTQAPPTLQPTGDGGTVATQPLPGDRDGLYGGTLNNAECDRDQMISFLSAHPTEAAAFVEALNTDPTLSWSGARPLTAADIPTYLKELTPVVLRLDTRVTNHGFDGTGPTAMQSVFQSGTAVMVDAHGTPRVRCYCGNPLTQPVALTTQPDPVGTPWPSYQPGALAVVEPSGAVLTVFVLVDIVTGQAFNRPAGTTGAADTLRTQPVGPPQSEPPSAPPPGPDIAGTYSYLATDSACAGALNRPAVDITVTLQGTALTISSPHTTMTGTLNADGSFTASGDSGEIRGAFIAEGGTTVMRGTATDSYTGCLIDYEATRH